MFNHLHLKSIVEYKTKDAINHLKEIAKLNRLHTKQLLKLRDRCYRVNGGNLNDYYDYWVDDIRWSLLKRELDNREHIPNKLENKLIRKRKFK